VSPEGDPFGRSRACFAELVGWLEGAEAAGLSHAELEDELDRRGRELLRQMLQGQLDLRALRERRAARVEDADGVRHGAVETGTPARSRRSSATSRSPGWPIAAAATPTSIRPTAS
jgi:hypothetical protein